MVLLFLFARINGLIKYSFMILSFIYLFFLVLMLLLVMLCTPQLETVNSIAFLVFLYLEKLGQEQM